MGKLIGFNVITLNGYFKGPGGDISWHKHGGEEGEYAAEMSQAGSTLLFGRVTYEMMAGYWPTPLAMEMAPAVATGMNNAEKIVFSKTLRETSWQNTRIISGNLEDE